MNKKIKITLISIVLALGACATTDTIYYWGDYTDTAYEYKSNPTEENLIKHKDELLAIIDQADKKGKKVPPGIYAELAKFEIDSNNINGAKQYLQNEKANFPESTGFVDSVLQLIGAGE